MGDARRQRGPTVRTADQPLQRSVQLAVATTLGTAELVLRVGLLPKLARHNGWLLAGIHHPFVLDITSIQNIRDQQPERRHAQPLAAVRSPGSAGPWPPPPAPGLSLPQNLP